MTCGLSIPRQVCFLNHIEERASSGFYNFLVVLQILEAALMSDNGSTAQYIRTHELVCIRFQRIGFNFSH